ncbi:MAG: tetratricopeptide repeat protein [Bacteroidota bacterium]|nr:tetratricopeptide repeat protein [Bacteroidota bacterium]
MDISELDIDFLSQKLADDPQSPLFARLADLYLANNQAEEALRLCEAGVSIYPTYTSAYIILGRCRVALKEKAKARTAFQKAAHLSPFNRTAKALLAEIPENATDEVHVVEDEFLAMTSSAQDAAEDSQRSVKSEIQKESPEIEPAAVTSSGTEHRQFSNGTEEKTVENTREGIPRSLEAYLLQKTHAEPKSGFISLDEYLEGVPVPAEGPDRTERSPGIESIAERLQNAGKIIPRTDMPKEQVPEPSSNETPRFESNIVTPTLAEIYASQGEYGAAIQAYEILILSKPEERAKFERRIKELQAKLYEAEGLV